MSRFRNIRVKMANGKHRMQRAMVLSSGKLKFVKASTGRGGSSTRKRHKSKGHAVAKKRRKSSRRGGGRRRSSGGSGFRGLMPDKETLHLGAGAAAFGWVESKAKSDPTFIANKLPRFIDALGWTGNTTLALHLANKLLFKNRYLNYLVRGGVIITGYQLGRRGKAFDKADEVFSISGDDDYLSGAESFLDDATMGALAAEAEVSGIPFDDAVEDAIAHT